MAVYTYGAQVDLAGALATLLGGGHLHLFNSAIPDNVFEPLATLTAAEAIFGGYATKVVPALLPPYTAAGGGQTVTMPGLQWNFTVAPTDIVYGWFLTDVTDATLYAYGSFPNPIGLNAVGDAISIVILFTIFNDGSIEIVVDAVEG